VRQRSGFFQFYWDGKKLGEIQEKAAVKGSPGLWLPPKSRQVFSRMDIYED
jgi:hypothetical protein